LFNISACSVSVVYQFVHVCMNCSDQFARAFHKGSRPSSALSGNVPSPIDHMKEPHYGNYTDEQSYMGPHVMPEGQSHLLSRLTEEN